MLSEEEKKLLKIFKAQVEKEKTEYFSVNAYTQLLYDSHKTVLNLITKLQKENEEKDKRIKELEEENRIFALEGSKINLELYIKENYIPKQAAIDKIQEYDKRMEEDAGHPNWVITDRIVMNVLQELLEGGK